MPSLRPPETTIPQRNERTTDKPEKTDLKQVHHLWIELRILGQRIEDQVVDSPDAVAVEKVGSACVEEQIAVSSKKTRTGSSDLTRKQK